MSAQKSSAEFIYPNMAELCIMAKKSHIVLSIALVDS